MNAEKRPQVMTMTPDAAIGPRQRLSDNSQTYTCRKRWGNGRNGWRFIVEGGSNRIDCSRDAHPDADEEPAGYGAQDGAGGGRDDRPPDEAGHG